MTESSIACPLKPRKQRVFAFSLGASFLLVAIMVIAIFTTGAPTADAATCTQSGGPPFNWKTPSMWGGCSGSYPGANAGDTAVLVSSGQTVTVDGPIANGVIVQSSAFATIAIPAGNNLTIEPSSTITSGNTIDVNGGTLEFDTGSFSSNANINLNTGTLKLTGNLAMVAGNGNFSFHQGTINGTGTLTLPSAQTSIWDGSGGAMTVDGATVDVFGTLHYTSSGGNQLELDNGAHIKIESGGSLGADGNDQIATNGISSPTIDILSGGGLSRSTSSTPLAINCAVNNGGTITMPGTGVVLKLLGGGTHSGNFNMGSGGQTVYFNGTHTFSAFTVAPTNSTFEVLGGTFTVNANGSIDTFIQDPSTTVNGSGNLTVNTSFAWTGGTQSGSGFMICGSSCTTTIGGNSILLLTGGRNFSNSGIINYTPTLGNLDIEGGGKISNTGVFNLNSTNPITSTTPSTSYIDNFASSVFHVGSTGNATVGAGFNLTGSANLQIASGAGLVLQGGNSAAGGIGGSLVIIDVSAVGSSLTFSGGNYSLNAGTGLTVNGSGPINLTGSATLFSLGSTYTAVPNFNQTGGTLKSGGATGISATSSYTFSGGTIDGNSVGGTPLNVPVGSQWNIDGAIGTPILTNGAHVKVDGTTNYTSSTNPLSMSNASQIDATGQFNYATSNGIDVPSGSSTLNITSTGFTKTNGGTSQVKAQFNITGAPMLINGGSLQLAGGGTLAPTAMTISGMTDRLEISGGATKTVAINSSVAVAGSGTVAVLGGNSKLGVNSTFVFAPANLELNSGGFITGPGQVNVANLKWLGGAFTGTGTTTLTGSGDMTALVSNPILADGYVFINNGGNIAYNPNFALTFNNSGAGGAQFQNSGTGTFDIQGNGSTVVVGAGHLITNTATITKSAGGGTFTFTVPFVNNAPGLVDVTGAASTIAFNNAADQMNGGTIQASGAGATVDILSTFSLGGGSFAGPGAIQLNGPSSLLFVNTALTFPAKFNMSNGVLSGNGLITIPNLAVFNWSGGTITTNSGTTAFNVSSGGTVNANASTSALIFDKRQLNINLGANWNFTTGLNGITFQTGAAVTNAGTFTVGAGTTSISTSTGSFLNTGTFTHTSAGSLIITVPFTNNGTVSDTAGTTAFNDTSAVTESGTFNAATGTFIEFGGGTHTLTGATPFGGTGTIKITAGTVQMNTSGTAGNFAILTGGTLTGAGNLTVSSNFAWLGGTMSGLGTTTVGGPTSMNTGALTLSRNLTLNGTTSFNDANNLTVTGASTITNNSTFDMANASSVICSSCTGNFVNNGTINHSVTNISTFGMPVTGTGAFTTTGGQTSFSAAANFASVNLNNGSVQFSGAPVTLGTVSKSGATTTNLFIAGGTTTISGTVNLPLVTDSVSVSGGGALVANNTVNVDSLFIFNGSVSGSGNITSTGNFYFHAGTMGSGGGTLTTGGAVTIDGLNGPMSLLRNWTNNAVANYAPTVGTNILTVGSSVAIVNNGTFNFTSQNLAATATPIATFTNSAGATLQRTTGPTGPLNFDPVVANAGSANWVVGTTVFANGYSQSAGTTALTGGNLTVPTLNINGGTLKGFNTITGNLSNAGTIDIANGVSPGALSVTGNFVQINTGTLKLDINGTTPGSTYDQLNVGGNIALAGTLQVVNPLGYTPANGDTYKVLTFGTNGGGTDFGTYTLPPAGGGTLQHAFIAGPPQALQLTAVTAAADLVVSKSVAGAVVAGGNATYSITVLNNGPTNTTNVVVSDTPPAGFTLVSVSGACTTLPCTIATLNTGQSAAINATYSVPASASGTVTNTASATSSVSDPNTANNTSAVTSTIVQQADLSVTKSGPATAMRGTQVTYSIIVNNLGPSNTTNVTVNDPQPTGLTISSVAGACTTLPCTIPALSASSSTTIVATYQVSNTAPNSVTNAVNVTSAITDPVASNNAASATTTIGCPSPAANLSPSANSTNAPLSGSLSWLSSGANSYKVYFGPAGSGCNAAPFATTTSTSVTYSNLMSNTSYEWRVESLGTSCPVATTQCIKFTTLSQCPQQGPATVAPASGVTVSSPVTFQWTAVPTAADYHVFVSLNGGASIDVGTSTTTSLTGINVGDGSVSWYVVANIPGCGMTQSASSSFNACNGALAPVVSVVSDAASGQSYIVSWDAVPGASKYEIDESNNAAFTTVSTQTVTTTSVSYTHNLSTTTPFFYRVRASGSCTQQFGPYSDTVRIVLIVIPPPTSKPVSTPNVNVPAGSKQIVVQTVFVPGIPTGTFTFTATTDKPWLTVNPSMGTLTPAGITLQVLADPTTLVNGTQTGTIIMTLNAAGKTASNATTSVSVPVSVSLVTPVTGVNKKGTPANALIIPSVGHLDGASSKWQSDVRVTNTAATKQSYLLTFTPDDPDKGSKQTTINVAAGDTTALDDIVKNWYGVGTLGETANGVLEVRPLDASGKGLTDNVSVSAAATVASSRTYNVASNGTLGQYIPAVPFAAFIGKGASPLSLQQVAQNAQYRTNVGIVEAAGAPAKALLSVFSSGGSKIFEQTFDLKANQQQQINGFLANNGITLDDGRIEVSVISGDGKVTGYASVVDNQTQDPLLVSGIQAAALSANHYVLPGVAALNNGFANWRSDVRIFNAAPTSQAATVTFYPINNGGDPIAKSLVIDPGQVKGLDDVVANFFQLGNGAGALHITTGNQSSLVVSARTYDRTESGTLGQFVPAVTSNDGVGKGGRALNILQVEDSVRYRTNVGVAEVSGEAATIEISAIIPDSKVIPKVTLELQPNEFIQSAVLQNLGLTNVYNARISVRVIDGNGKIAAYGSVIDQQTQDPTYVPAQ